MCGARYVSIFEKVSGTIARNYFLSHMAGNFFEVSEVKVNMVMIRTHCYMCEQTH